MTGEGGINMTGEGAINMTGEGASCGCGGEKIVVGTFSAILLGVAIVHSPMATGTGGETTTSPSATAPLSPDI